MSATKELMLEACENIGLDATMCAEWSPSTLARVQCEMGRLLATKSANEPSCEDCSSNMTCMKSQKGVEECIESQRSCTSDVKEKTHE